MTETSGDPTGPLGIVELAGWCASMRDTSLRWFRLVGSWVVDTEDPRLQRWFAEAGHRHAWHAELWQRRLPAIPPAHHLRSVPDRADDVDRAVPRARREADHLAALDRMLAELDRASARIDADLDPPTLRTIGLVRADVRELRSQSTTG